MKSFNIDQELRSDGTYVLHEPIFYFSRRYRKPVVCNVGMISDGATGIGVPDLVSRGYWVHDQLCNTGEFSDGTPCTVWQASMILHDILLEEGRWFRARTWFLATWLFGGGECKANGYW